LNREEGGGIRKEDWLLYKGQAGEEYTGEQNKGKGEAFEKGTARTYVGKCEILFKESLVLERDISKKKKGKGGKTRMGIVTNREKEKKKNKKKKKKTRI